MYIRHYIFPITIMIATLIAARQPAELTTHHLQAAPSHLGLCGEERSSPRSPQCPHSGRRATSTSSSGRRTSTTSTTSPLECKTFATYPSGHRNSFTQVGKNRRLQIQDVQRLAVLQPSNWFEHCNASRTTLSQKDVGNEVKMLVFKSDIYILTSL